MGPLSKKSLWQKALFSRVTLALLLLSCFSLSFAVYNRYRVEREVYTRQEEARAELTRETIRKQELEDRVNYLNNEQGMEAEIRRHFDVALDGEQVVVIVGERGDAGQTDALPKVGQPRGFWERWWPW